MNDFDNAKMLSYFVWVGNKSYLWRNNL